MSQKMRCQPSRLIGLEAGSYEAWCIDEAAFTVMMHLANGRKLRPKKSEDNRIKHSDDGRYFLCKGKEKVTAEFALSALAYNIRRAINICGGVQKLIDLYRRIPMPKIRKIAEI